MKNILYAILASFILSQDVVGIKQQDKFQPLDNSNQTDQIINNIENMISDIQKISKYDSDTILINQNLKELITMNDNSYLGITQFTSVGTSINLSNNKEKIENYEDLVDAILKLELAELKSKPNLLNIINNLKIALITEIDENNSVEDILRKSLVDQFNTFKNTFANIVRIVRSTKNKFIDATRSAASKFVDVTSPSNSVTDDVTFFLNLFPDNIKNFLEENQIFQTLQSSQTLPTQTLPKIKLREQIIENMPRTGDNRSEDSRYSSLKSIIDNNLYYKWKLYQLKNSQFQNIVKDIDRKARLSFFVWQDDGYCYNLYRKDDREKLDLEFTLKKDPMYKIKQSDPSNKITDYNQKLESANKLLKEKSIKSLKEEIEKQLSLVESKINGQSRRINILKNNFVSLD